jgi:outer membrane immunogenic protein
MRFTISGAAAALLLASIAPAGAQAPPPPPPMAPPMMMGTAPAWDAWQGWYAGVNLGAGWGDTSASLTPNGCLLISGCGAGGPPTFSRSVNFSGPLGGVQFGYNWHVAPSWLLGLETDFDGSGVTTHGSTHTNTLPAPLTGTATSSVSAGQDYLGTVRGRIGWVATPDLMIFGTGGFAYGQEHVAANVSFSSSGASFTGNKSDLKTGWVAGGGVEYAFAPQWSLRGEYLYVDLGNNSDSVHLISPTPPGVVPGVGYRTSVSTGENIIRVAVNYHFGAPPPPPAPVAAPAPPPAAPKVFIVFFDWDKDTVTPEGQQIIVQAADAYKAGAPVQIQVTGYTDRSGSPGYNQRLSERRANNVAKALAALGVPKSQMIVSGRGENDNRVPTADGVREPQNRRVEIVSP